MLACPVIDPAAITHRVALAALTALMAIATSAGAGCGFVQADVDNPYTDDDDALIVAGRYSITCTTQSVSRSASFRVSDYFDDGRIIDLTDAEYEDEEGDDQPTEGYIEAEADRSFATAYVEVGDETVVEFRVDDEVLEGGETTAECTIDTDGERVSGDAEIYYSI